MSQNANNRLEAIAQHLAAPSGTKQNKGLLFI
jgi:hypothetical protein